MKYNFLVFISVIFLLTGCTTIDAGNTNEIQIAPGKFNSIESVSFNNEKVDVKISKPYDSTKSAQVLKKYKISDNNDELSTLYAIKIESDGNTIPLKISVDGMETGLYKPNIYEVSDELYYFYLPNGVEKYSIIAGNKEFSVK